jgi:alkanesulfonate monooxygenase SsuD/methylene tetrahydromethanopterin reductase-like flavin-dependent oxidoreductase (luciferase family)
MRFGLSLPLAGALSDLTLVTGLAKEAEASGWDGCFVWDHLSTGVPIPLADPWLALALIAQATEHMRIGPLVTPLFRRDPAKLAYETVTLDHLSKGRLTLGVGLGSNMFGELSSFGGPNDRVRAEMLDEGLAILTGLWSGEPFSFAGMHNRLDGARVLPAGLQKPRIPIWVAASWGKHAPMRRAARYDGVVPVRGDLQGSLTPAQVQEMVAYIQRFRSVDDHFDVIQFGLTRGRRPFVERAVIESYAEVGVTWWIETMPSEPQLDFEQMLQHIRLGPPTLRRV